jgi:hypothetical protein
MLKKTIAILGAGFLLSVAVELTGCMDTPTSPNTGLTVSANDQAAIENMVATDALFTSDATMMDDGSPSSNSDAAVTDTTTVKKWGRQIDWSQVSRTVTYEQVDSVTVEATITNMWGGKIWIKKSGPAGDTIIYKPFSESSVRKVLYIKVANTAHAGLNWRMKEVSAMQGGTTNAQNVTIEKVDFYVGADTIEITDPLNYFLIEGVHGSHCLEELTPSVNAPFKVQVTVKSSDPDSDLVTARRPFLANNSWSYRCPMALISSMSNGDGTFTRVYGTSWKGAWIGRFHVMIGAVPRSAIYSDTTSFSSQIWGIPYIVD